MDVQGFFNAISDEARRNRALYHLTLAEFIKVLSSLPENTTVLADGVSIGREGSYRGYYSDLAFEPSSIPSVAGDVLTQCKRALGATYEGYKGGDFVMTEGTPLWLAEYGCTGRAIVGADYENGALTLKTRDVE